MNHHSFEVQVAIDFDVQTALLLNSMAFWSETNAANKKHLHDDRVWLFNSYEAWTLLFPYWTSKQMRRILSNAEINGLIVTGNYNKRAADLTKWYALSDKGLEYYPKLKALLLNTPAQTGKPPAQTGKPPAQTGNALPYTNTDSNPKKKTTTTHTPKFKGDRSSSDSFKGNAISCKTVMDTRTDEEFLDNVMHHLEHNSDSSRPMYMRERMILKLLINMFSANQPFHSVGFVSDTEKLERSRLKREKDYMERYLMYRSQFLNDRDNLKIKFVQGKEPLSFEEFKQMQGLK